VAGSFEKDINMKFLYSIILFVTLTNIINAQEDEPFWDYLGGPQAGYIIEHKIDSNNNIYLSSNNGLFISKECGQSWNQLIYDDNIIDFDINHNNFAFAIVDKSIINYEIMYSKNYGLKWDYFPSIWDDNTIPYKICSNQDSIYILLVKEKSYRIIYTSDFGNTWNEYYLDFSTDNLEEWRFYDFDISSNGISYIIGTMDVYSSNKEFILINHPHQENWERVDIVDKGHIKKLHFITENEFYVATNKSLYYTSNRGNTWTILFDEPTCDVFNINSDDFYITNCNDAVYHTTDKGKTWEKLGNGLETGFHLQVSQLIDGKLITSGYPGFYYSSNNGKKWIESNEGFTACNANSISFDSNGNIYTIQRDFFKSTDNGETWKRIYFPEAFYSIVFITKNNTVIIAGSNDMLMISRDNGETFHYPNILINNKKYIYQASSGRIFAGGYGLHYSDDDGETWTKTTGIGTTYGFAENNEGHLFATGTTGRIFRSIDQGLSFHLVQELIITDQTENGDIIFSNDKPIGIKCSDQYRTTDNGASWLVTDNKARGRRLAKDSLGNIYMLYIKPLKKSKDCFETFDTVSSKGLFHNRFNDIEVSPDGYIYLAAEYGGIYRSKERYVSVEDNNLNPSKVKLSPPTPNPTTGETKISFQLPESGEVNIKVSDVLGNIIINRSNKYYSKGRHTEIINFDRKPSGVYLISLSAFGEIVTEKIEVVK
jgi:photosystem II stability/assembly factor-like uncharacterized protein